MYRQTYLQSRNRDTNVENKHTDTKGEWGDGMDGETGINICKHMYKTDN